VPWKLFPSKIHSFIYSIFSQNFQLIPQAECQFELRSDSDRIRFKMSALRRRASASSGGTGSSVLSFSFRTSKPNGRLLEVLDGGNGPLGALDLVDGSSKY
jgi:hypothetical protein